LVFGLGLGCGNEEEETPGMAKDRLLILWATGCSPPNPRLVVTYVKMVLVPTKPCRD
jgi:hypothetical protein